MGESIDRSKLLNSRSLSNTLYILIDREATGRIKENYSASIAEDYNLGQGSVSGNLNKLESMGIVNSTKDGRRNIFRVNWDALTALLYEYPDEIHYFDLTREELRDRPAYNTEFENEEELYDSWLSDFKSVAKTKEFEEFFKQVMLYYCKNVEVEKSEGGHLNKPRLNEVLLTFSSKLSEIAEKFINQIQAIEEISEVSEEEAMSSLRIEEPKKELLSDIRPLYIQYWHQDQAVLGDETKKTISKAIDTYLGIYSRRAIMIEEDLLDRIP